MCDNKRSTYTRVAAFVTSLVMIAVVLVSAFFIAHEAGHECEDDDCPICACIAGCERIICEAFAGTRSGAAVFMPFMLLVLAVSAVVFVTQKTLVSRKVRIND